MAEHMRVSLIDPKWKEQRDVMLAKLREKTKASDGEIGNNLMSLAKTRPDIFGSTQEEVSQAVQVSIKEKLMSGSNKPVVWDGVKQNAEAQLKAIQESRQNDIHSQIQAALNNQNSNNSNSNVTTTGTTTMSSFPGHPVHATAKPQIANVPTPPPMPPPISTLHAHHHPHHPHHHPMVQQPIGVYAAPGAPPMPHEEEPDPKRLRLDFVLEPESEFLKM